MIGALGAIGDITVTQASAVWELRSTDPTMTRRRLLRSGMLIGRDHVASTVLRSRRLPAGTVANGEIVATAIVRTLVGSLGLIASVPITTWLAVPIASPSGRHGGTVAAVCAAEADAGPEEHPIPEHRRDLWRDVLRSWRSARRS